MRSKTVRLGFKRCSNAAKRECREDKGDKEKEGRLAGTVGLYYSFTLPAIVSASFVVSLKLPLPAPSGPLPPRIRASFLRRPLARRRQLLFSYIAYTFFLHPYYSLVCRHCRFFSPIFRLSLSLSLFSTQFHLSCPRSMDSTGSAGI